MTACFASSGITASCAPIERASANRRGLMSVAMMRAAPAARQMPTANAPMGPQPVIRTTAPGMFAVSAV